MAKKYYWLKLMKDFFQQPKIKKLRRVAGGDTYTVIYLKLQLLSLENGGKLFFEGVEDNFVDEVALTIDEDEENVRFTLMYLEKQGLIEKVDDNEFVMPEAVARMGSETGAAERMRRLRERKKEAFPAEKAAPALPDASQCDAVVTGCDDTVTIEKDTDIEKREREEKEAQSASAGKPAPTPSKRTKGGKLDAKGIDAMLTRYAPNPEALDLLREWVKVRKAKRAPETEKALTLNLDKLEALAQESGLTVNGYLEAVIARGWAAFYPIREGFASQTRQADNRSRIKTEAEHAVGHEGGSILGSW